MGIDDKVHRELRSVWDTMSPMRIDDVVAVRNELDATTISTPRDPAISWDSAMVPGLSGAPAVRVRTFVPATRPDTPIAAVVWMHGGGFLFGGAEDNDGMAQLLARETGALVVSVDYRLAPEHPFPCGLEDCYAVLTWLAAESTRLGVDRARIGVGGVSAGGGLAAGLALLARDRGGPAIAVQMPLYPMLDDRNVTPASHEITDSRTWSRDKNLTAWRHYLGHEPGGDSVSPFAAPARARDLAGLPPAYTMVGTVDLFRDETIDYMSRLSQAGVPVEWHVVPGGFHAFEHAVPDAEVSRRVRCEYVSALRRGLSGQLI